MVSGVGRGEERRICQGGASGRLPDVIALGGGGGGDWRACW